MSIDVLFKARCSKGHLIVYRDRVGIEHSILGDSSLPFSKITGSEVQVKAVPIPFISKGLATLKIFSQGSQELVANLLTAVDAKKAKSIIDSKIA